MDWRTRNPTDSIFCSSPPLVIAHVTDPLIPGFVSFEIAGDRRRQQIAAGHGPHVLQRGDVVGKMFENERAVNQVPVAVKVNPLDVEKM